MNEYCQGIVFSEKAYNFIIDESFNKDPLETGGILLGHILDNGVWLVMEVLPPGPNSIFQIAYFEYDTDFVNYLAQSVASQYNIKLSLLGLWHRHPGSMDTFSSTDNETNRTYAELNEQQGALSGLVNIDPNFRLTMYHVDPNDYSYTNVEIAVGDEIIPERYFELKHFPQKGLNPASPNHRCYQLAVNNQLNDFFKPLPQLFLSDSDRDGNRDSDLPENVMYKQEIEEIERIFPAVQVSENDGILNISFTHNNDWHLDLRYAAGYKGQASELRVYIENNKLANPYSSQLLPYVLFDSNGDLFLNAEDILTDRSICGRNAIEQSIKWIGLYEKLLERKIDPEDFKL